MEKIIRKEAPDNKIMEEQVKFAKREDAVKYIGEFVTSDKKEPRFLSIEILNMESFRAFGYRKVATVKASDFIVHVCDGKGEFSLELSVGLDICKKYRKETFDKSTLENVLKTQSKLEKLPDARFKELVTVFSALNNQNTHLVPYEHVRMGRDDLQTLTNEYEKQLNAIVLLTKLETSKPNESTEKVVREVLETISTDNFITACREYGFKDKGDIASALWSREKKVKQKSFLFVNKWEEINNPQERSVEFNREVGEIGRDICELDARRRIRKYDKDISEGERSINSDEERAQSMKEGPAKEGYARSLENDKKYLERQKTMRSNLEKTLTLIRWEQMVIDESHKS